MCSGYSQMFRLIISLLTLGLSADKESAAGYSCPIITLKSLYFIFSCFTSVTAIWRKLLICDMKGIVGCNIGRLINREYRDETLGKQTELRDYPYILDTWNNRELDRQYFLFLHFPTLPASSYEILGTDQRIIWSVITRYTPIYPCSSQYVKKPWHPASTSR